MEKSIKKEYSNGELTVVWQPHKCIHSEICVQTLPEVYNPNSKPWIKAENASSEDLVDQIKNCPSGALGYYFSKADKNMEEKVSGTRIEIMKNGPIVIEGPVSLNYKGNESTHKTTALCRCGKSGNKPFCDGTHKKIGFED